MTSSGQSKPPASPRRLGPWVTASVVLGSASFIATWLIPCSLNPPSLCVLSEFTADTKIPLSPTTGISLIVASWTLGAAWCGLFVATLMTIGKRGLWVLTSAPFVLFGPLLLAFYVFFLFEPLSGKLL